MSNGDPQREAELDRVCNALRGRDPDQHSEAFNKQADEIVALFDQGRRDFAYEVWAASPVMQRETPASDEDEWREDEEFAALDELDDDEDDEL